MNWLSLLTLLFLSTPVPVMAQPAEPSPVLAIGLPLLNFSRDSDQFKIEKVAFGIYPWKEHAAHYTGIELQAARYRQDDWSANGQALHFVHKDVDAASGLGNLVRIGYSVVGGHRLLATESEISRATGTSTRLSGFVSRDWVEAQAALDRGVYFTLVGAGIEQRLLPRLSGVISLAHTLFSDANAREQAKFRLIWDAWPQHGVTLQFQRRQAWGNDDAFPRLYFNPSRYTEDMALLGWRERWKGWQFAALLGLGSQQVNQAAHEPTRLVDLSLSSPPEANWQVRGRVGLRESAGAAAAQSVYHFMQLDVVYAF